MEISIHQVSVKEFVRYLPAMFKSIEWKKNESELYYYMSGHLKIKDLEIVLFSENYEKPLDLTNEKEGL